jgi:hypothetical protein
LFVLVFVCKAAMPTRTPQTVTSVFQLLAAVLAIVLLTWLGWWCEAGFNSPSWWRNLHLL